MKRFAYLLFLAVGCSQSPTKPSVIEKLPVVESKPEASKPVAKQPQATKPEVKIYTRDEFQKLVYNKSKDGVVKSVGKPNSTTKEIDHGYEMLVWVYKRTTKDEYAKEIDREALVWFTVQGGEEECYKITFR
jgi:hypothetical protein